MIFESITLTAALGIIGQLAELRWRLRSNPVLLSQHSKQVARILASVDEYKQEMQDGLQALHATQTHGESPDLGGMVAATESKFTHLQHLVEGLRVHEPIIPIPGDTVDHDVPKPQMLDTSTLKLFNADGSEECEVAWHREVPALYQYAGRTFYRLNDHARADGVWEFKHVA